MGSAPHIPVMLEETMAALDVGPGKRYCDATLGGAGHARAILQRSAPDGQLVGLDRDPEALERAAQALAPFGDRVMLRRGNFADLVELLRQRGLVPVDGVLVDLGISSHQLDDPRRGFGFSSAGPLDMRLDASAASRERTAAELIARASVEELAALIRTYGEEPASRRIARAIKQAHERGELADTQALARVVATALGGRGPRGRKIHPATRTFMALRIAVNDELGSLRRFLDTFTEALRPGGRVAVIAFHSLEDRAVKQRFAELAHPCVCPPDLPVCGCGRVPKLRLLGARALRPGEAELERNPRARSARLRAAEVLP